MCCSLHNYRQALYDCTFVSQPPLTRFGDQPSMPVEACCLAVLGVSLLYCLDACAGPMSKPCKHMFHSVAMLPSTRMHASTEIMYGSTNRVAAPANMVAMHMLCDLLITGLNLAAELQEQLLWSSWFPLNLMNWALPRAWLWRRLEAPMWLCCSKMPARDRYAQAWCCIRVLH